METNGPSILRKRWKTLVDDYARERREGARKGLSSQQLRAIDTRYGIQIDLAYAAVKEAEKLEHLAHFAAAGE